MALRLPVTLLQLYKAPFLSQATLSCYKYLVLAQLLS